MSTYQVSFIRNTLKEALCALCLSQNRRFVVNLKLLQSVTENFPKLRTDFDADCDKICWECEHHLKRMLRFMDQVRQARLNLDKIVNEAGSANTVLLGSLSKLCRSGIRSKVNIDPSPQYTAVSTTEYILPVPLHNAVQSTANILLTYPQNAVYKGNITEELPYNAGQNNAPGKIKIELEPETISNQDQINPSQEMNIKQEPEQVSEDPLQCDDLGLNIIKEEFNRNKPNIITLKTADMDKKTSMVIKRDIVKQVNNSPKMILVDSLLKIRPDLSDDRTQFDTKTKNMLSTRVTSETSETKKLNTKISSGKFKTENIMGASKIDVKISIMSKDVIMNLRDKESKIIKNLGTGFYCDKCVMNIENEEAYNSHMAQHDPSAGSEVCDICEMRFKTVQALMLHNQEHYKVMTCCHCSESWPFMCRFMSSMLSHIKLHANPPWLQCAYCGNVYETLEYLEIHIKSMHQLTCPHCRRKPTKFMSPQTLADHIQRVHTEFKCEKCHMTIKGRTQLRRHQESSQCQLFIDGQLHLHGGEGKPYCVKCKLFFKSRAIFVSHMQLSNAHWNGKCRFECDYCSKCYRTKTALALHIKYKHDRTRTNWFSCRECGKMFPIERSLKRHKAHVHDKQKLPRDKICEVCGKAFTTMPQLRMHRNSHTGERPYQCKLCEWNFTGSGALWTHMKLKHTDKTATKDLRERRKKSIAKKKGINQKPLKEMVTH